MFIINGSTSGTYTSFQVSVVGVTSVFKGGDPVADAREKLRAVLATHPGVEGGHNFQFYTLDSDLSRLSWAASVDAVQRS